MSRCELAQEALPPRPLEVTLRQIVRVAGRMSAMVSAFDTGQGVKGNGRPAAEAVALSPGESVEAESTVAHSARAVRDTTVTAEPDCNCACEARVLCAKQLSRKLSRLARQVGRQLKALDSSTGSDASAVQWKALCASATLQSRLVDAFALQGADRGAIEHAVRAVAKDETSPPWRATLKSIVAATDGIAALGRDAGGELRNVETSVVKLDAGASDAGSSTQGLDAAATLVVLLEAAVAGVVRLVAKAFPDWLADLFNAEDDDRARRFIQVTRCDDLRAMTTEGLYRLVLPMLEGPTGDDDERAILQLLNCLHCHQVRALFYLLDRRGWPLMDEFHGPEFERLLIRLQACGILAFSEWDDETTRRYIMDRRFSCTELAQLPLEHVRMLLRNLFSGPTGNEDEEAILALVACQSCARRRQLVQMPGMSVDDFDDEVDGAEWRRLRSMFRACGIAVP